MILSGPHWRATHLEQQLNEHGYHQSLICPGLWKHQSQPISFTLCVDDFGVKYIGCEHAKHILKVLNMNYKCLQEWEGKKYLVMEIDWEYVQCKVCVNAQEKIPKC